MLEKVQLKIPGNPHGKERPQFSARNRRMYTPTKTINYEELTKVLYKQAYGTQMFPKGVPLDLRIYSYHPIPESDSLTIRAKKLAGIIRPTIKPDFDNVVKIVADALNKIAYYDDSQIVDSITRKFYSDNPRVEVLIQITGGQHNE